MKDDVFKYLIAYKNKANGHTNISTCFDLKEMLNRKDIEIIGVYKKLTDSQINEIVSL